MPRKSTIPAPGLHVVTVREALEPLYMKLEREAELRLVAAAMQAGWSADEAFSAIDDLRREDVQDADLQDAGGQSH